LHEFYFKQTEREPYLAGVAGANLVREVLDQLNQAAGKPRQECMRPSGDSKFVGLVGHDTNLANVQTLLNVTWSFIKDQQLPADWPSLRANDLLPAGALGFDLNQTGPANYGVPVQYMTQSLNQKRNPREEDKPYFVLTSCPGDDGNDVRP